jgi:MFS superfamily sulfate permease-like transporter
LKIGLAVIHAGVVTKYLSDVIVAGFTTGAAYHIVVSQLGAILGISIHHSQDNPFKLADVIHFMKCFNE